MYSTDKTVRVRRGGTILTVSEAETARYIAKGYDVVDSNGKVIRQSTPNDVLTLKKAYEEHVAEIKKLKEELAKAMQQIEELKAQPVEQSKLFNTEVEQTEVKEDEPVERKTYKRSKKSV